MGNFTQSNITFTIENQYDIGGYGTKKTRAEVISSNKKYNASARQLLTGYDEFLINAVDIDWNAGEMPEFNGGSRTINNAGDLLKAIQDASNSGGTIPETYTAATSSKLGLIKIGYTQSGQNYPVKLDSNSKAYVEVPWTDTNTTYSAATTSTLGLMKPSNKISTSQTLTSSNGTTASRYYGVQMDKDGLAFVNIPWTDTKVTSAANHYNYAAGNAKTTSALYKITIDGAGHITGATLATKNDILSGITISDIASSNDLANYIKSIIDNWYEPRVDPVVLETPTRGSWPSSIDNGSSGNITFTTNVPATVTITTPDNGTSDAGWTAAVTSSAGTSHTIKITNNRTATTDTSVYTSSLKVTVTAVSPNTGTVTNWNPNNGTIAIPGKPSSTYTVTFNPNGGSVSESTRTINAGSAVGTLPTPTRANYVFAGWAKTSTATTSNVTASTVPTGNVTYYAVWGGQLDTPTRGSWPSSIPNGSSGNITFTTNVPATVTITTPDNGTSDAGWTAAVTSSAGTSHTIKITNNRTATTDTSVYTSSLKVTVTAVSPNTGTVTNWNPNNGTIAIPGKPTSTYYWYAGQTAPTTMSSNPTVDDTNFTNNKWHTLGSATQISQTITGGTAGTTWKIAVPTSKSFKAYASDLQNIETSWTKTSTITINNVSYDVWTTASTGAKVNVYMK